MQSFALNKNSYRPKSSGIKVVSSGKRIITTSARIAANSIGSTGGNWVAVYLATITYGAIIVPILQDFRANDAIHIINHSESKLLFISDINWEGIELDQIPHVLATISLNDWHPITLKLNPKKINYDAINALFKKKYPDG